MDRHRGSSSGYRNSSTSHYSSSDYTSRNFEHNQQNRRGRGGNSSHHGWSGEKNSYSAPKDYDRYSSDKGSKRRYDHSTEHKKSYDHHEDYQEPSRKYHRSDGNHNYEGRSNHHPHHRSQYEHSSSSNRGRNNSYENGRPSSYDDDSYQRRYNENRRYQPRGAGSGSSSGHRGGGGYVSNRGRGRGRGANRSQGVGLYQHSKMKDYQSERTEDSSSPNRMSVAEESACASDVPSVSPSRQPPENNQEDVSSDKVTAARSESDKSTREETDRDKENSLEKPELPMPSTNKSEDDQSSRVEEEGKKEIEPSPKRKSASKEVPEHFIRLQCPHCNQRSVTFRDYIAHLGSQRHAKSLEKVSLQHRMSLAKLRTRQRKEQLQIEAQSSRSSHSSRMNFCAICKLCHSESRPNHETTELHKIIKNFLMPYCPICRVNFKSRMLYEKHVAALPHIKNKVNMERSYERRREEERKHDRNGLYKDEVVLDLGNFMTLDAVGSVDGDADNGVSLEETAVGQEYVKKVEAYFCEVCQRYLSRAEPLEKGLEFHCRSRLHHRAFEERQNGSKVLDEDRTEGEESQDQARERGSLTRSESQELLLIEAEKDIGKFCDSIGDNYDEQGTEECGEDQPGEDGDDDDNEQEKEPEPEGDQEKEQDQDRDENTNNQEFSEVRVKCEKE